MRVLINIPDSKSKHFLQTLKSLTYVKTQSVSEPDAELLNEIKEIKKAFKNAEAIKSGKLKSRPVQELLNEL